jgi:superfamily II DNA or RNA helicase
MNNIVNIKYSANGNSTISDGLGMREMQQKAFKARNNQYLLLKSPPASGKSRALMYIALDKLKHGAVSKVIVAVPQRTIGSSFEETILSADGFHSDWKPSSEFNLCLPGNEGKIDKFVEFFGSAKSIMICTHATLRTAFEKIGEEEFDSTLLAIDEFHHVSASYENKLGELIRAIMNGSNSHILAMTGSYFRGDRLPVLMPEDERKFYKVTYNLYEQLNGYKHLESLGIGFHFYQGVYTGAIGDILDNTKKTIVHIPHPASGESTKDKLREVDQIIDVLGTVIHEDESGIYHVQTDDGRVLKVADLVNDNSKDRAKVEEYLRNVESIGDLDIIIALGMAKEGFDWPFCEHALTVAYRGSLTEIVQIIGRCTRDSENKSHAQFTNLIAEPDADNESVIECVNNMLKAIAASLLMEQILAPNLGFIGREPGVGTKEKGQITIEGFASPSTERVKNIIEADLPDLKVAILQDPEIINTIPGTIDPETLNTIFIPKVIREKYPDLEDQQVEEVRQHVVADSVLRNTESKESNGKKFFRLAESFVDIDDLTIDLIDKVNPFQRAFEVISKTVTPKALRAIQDCITALKIRMTDDEAELLWPKINDFVKATGRHPNLDSLDPTEIRLAEALVYIRNLKRQSNTTDE